MKKKDLVRTLVITLGYVLMFLAIDYKINGYLNSKYALIFIVIGAGMLLYEEILWKKPKQVNWGLGLPAVIRTFSYILLFLGVKTYLIQYVSTQWIWFVVAGFLIYNYHDKIVDKLVPNGTTSTKNLGGGLM